MTENQITPEEFAALVAEPLPENTVPDDGSQLGNVPCTIYTDVARAGAFIVEQVNAWTYTPQGVFATGHWLDEDVERDLLLPYESIKYYEFDFAALETHKDAIAALEQLAAVQEEDEAA